MALPIEEDPDLELDPDPELLVVLLVVLVPLLFPFVLVFPVAWAIIGIEIKATAVIMTKAFFMFMAAP